MASAPGGGRLIVCVSLRDRVTQCSVWKMPPQQPVNLVEATGLLLSAAVSTSEGDPRNNVCSSLLSSRNTKPLHASQIIQKH